MSKEQAVADAVSAIQAGQAQVLNDQLGMVYDKAVQENPPSGGGLTQADIDAAVAAAMAPLQAELDSLKAKIAQIIALLS